MSNNNLVSAVLSLEDKSQINNSINAINAALPFLLAMSNEDRRGGLKLGDKSVAFIEKAIDYAIANPHLVPPYINMVEIQKDYQLQKDLIDVLQLLYSLSQKIEDTQQEAGAEAYNGILGFYQAVNLAVSKDIPGARAIQDDLSKRFPGKKKQKEGTVPPQQA